MAVLTISRQFGAGGKTMAQRVADRLGYDVATEAIIEELAREAQVSPDGLPHFETEHAHLLEKDPSLVSEKSFVARLLEPGRRYMDGRRYVELLSRIIPRIAETGDTVILGRGAQFILRDRPDAFHVLMIAGEGDRIRFMEENYGLSEEDARRTVSRQGRRRAKLMRLFHHEDYDRAGHYDLVLNMSRLTLGEAVGLACGLVTREKHDAVPAV